MQIKATRATTPSRPSHAELAGLRAGFVSRAVAFIFDLIIVLVMAGATYLLISGMMTLMHIDISECRQWVPIVDWRSLLANLCRLTRFAMIVLILLIAPFYLLGLWLFGGRTIGMGIVGLRVVRTNGQRLRLYTAFVRLIGFIACLLTLGFGFAWAIFDYERQGLHDKIAGTCVIYYTGKLMQQHLQRPTPAAAVDTAPAPIAAPLDGATARHAPAIPSGNAGPVLPSTTDELI